MLGDKWKRRNLISKACNPSVNVKEISRCVVVRLPLMQARTGCWTTSSSYVRIAFGVYCEKDEYRDDEDQLYRVPLLFLVCLFADEPGKGDCALRGDRTSISILLPK